MNKNYVEMLRKGKLTLIASLPQNDPELARYAWENGADVVKVHINVEHRASKTIFRSFRAEYENLKEILMDAKGPVGIVLGGDLESAERDFPYVLDAGFDFMSQYIHHTPASVISSERITKMLAPDYSYSIDEICQISKLSDVLEASVMHPEAYGTRLNGRDLLYYSLIAANTDIPVVVPTQKNILPEELGILQSTGVKGIMIGAIVTGKEKETVSKAVYSYKDKILSL